MKLQSEFRLFSGFVTSHLFMFLLLYGIKLGVLCELVFMFCIVLFVPLLGTCTRVFVPSTAEWADWP